MPWAIVPIKEERWIKPEPKKVRPTVAGRAERRLEREQLAEDIARIDRSKLPQLNLKPKVGLRKS